MRYYFHLVGPNDDAFPDEIGIEASCFEAAKAEALVAIHEIRADHEDVDVTWRGWHLEIADASQEVIFTIALELRRHLQHVREKLSAGGGHIVHALFLALGLGLDQLVPILA